MSRKSAGYPEDIRQISAIRIASSGGSKIGGPPLASGESMIMHYQILWMFIRPEAGEPDENLQEYQSKF